MKIRLLLKIRASGSATNAEIVKKIKDEAKARIKDIQRMAHNFAFGTVKFRYGSFGDYENSKDFRSDWIMYRRALCDTFDCEIEQLACEKDNTLRNHVIAIELFLVGE